MSVKGDPYDERKQGRGTLPLNKASVLRWHEVYIYLEPIKAPSDPLEGINVKLKFCEEAEDEANTV